MKTLPHFKIKLKVEEHKQLFLLIKIMLDNQYDLINITQIDYYNLKSMNRSLMYKLCIIDPYQHNYKNRCFTFKIDINVYESFKKLYLYNKHFLDGNIYYENLFQSIINTIDSKSIYKNPNNDYKDDMLTFKVN